MQLATHVLSRASLLALTLLLAATPVAAQKKAKPKELPPLVGTSTTFESLGITVTIPEVFTELKEAKQRGGQLLQRWTAKYESVALDISLFSLPISEFRFDEPEDVTEVLLDNVRDPKRGDPSFSFQQRELISGKFGVTPYASLAWGERHDEKSTKAVGTQFYLAGLSKDAGYTLEVYAEPVPGPEGVKVIADFLRRGVVYQGETRDPKWTKAEIDARWEKDKPEKLAGKLEVMRTKHYIVFTNSSGGKSFGEQMELNYEAIKAVYPFDEVEGRKLMPVFLFRMPEEYHAYFAKKYGTTIEEAAKSKGVASGDAYATYFDAKQDPVHIHEGTHQIFSARLRLSGGGSWFQEGVAEYMSTTKNDRNDAARIVKKERHVPLEKFVAIKSLLFSPKDAEATKRGEDQAGDQYAQAACLIEFLRESKFGKDKFQEFLHTVGLVPRQSRIAIERAIQTVYGTDLAGLEKEWVEYCKKR